MWRHGFDPWVRKILWKRILQPTPVVLPGESHRQKISGGKSDSRKFQKAKLKFAALAAVYVVFTLPSRASLLAQMVKRLPAIGETWVPSPGREDPLEEGMATHSSSLAWGIPWMEEPGRLQSIGSHRVGYA